MNNVVIPAFDWEKMKAVAEDKLCPECDGQDHCAACLAIKGTRWALQMRSTLEALTATPEPSTAQGGTCPVCGLISCHGFFCPTHGVRLVARPVSNSN